MTGEEILVQLFLGLAKREELHFAAVLLDGVVNEFDELIVSDPTVGMEDHGHRALVEDGGVERGFPVGDSGRVIDAMMALSFPIAGNNGGKFPAELSDDVWIWIILDGCDE